jgi:SAM-dependent methyltransferase
MEDIDQKAHWDRKYEEGLSSLTKPDPFFVSTYERHVAPSFPNAGVALDLAAGLGRHALWLADRGWQVSAVDISSVAIGKLSQGAARLNVKMNFFTGDAAECKFEPELFDLIVLYYHFDRSLFPKIFSALNHGGLFLCKMSVNWGTELALARANLKLLYQDEIVSLLPGLLVIDHHERPVRDRGVIEIAARKPFANRL